MSERLPAGVKRRHYDIITLRLDTELQFLLFVAQTTCVGRHALEVAELRILAFEEGWGAFLTTLVGALIYPVAYEYAGSTVLDTTTLNCLF